MGDNVHLGDRNGVRTPMQWDGGWNAGFSTADPESLYAALILNPLYGYQAVNVQSQKRTPHSLLSWTRRLIQVRKSSAVFGRGSIEFLYPENHRILAYVRQLGNETVLAVNNLSQSAQAVELDLEPLPRQHSDRDVWQKFVSARGKIALSFDAGPLPVLLVSFTPALRPVVNFARKPRMHSAPLKRDFISICDGGAVWRKRASLSDELVRQLISVGEVDLLVGLPTYNDAQTVGQVVQVIRAGLLKYFPRERAAILNADGGSQDETPGLVQAASISDARNPAALRSLRTLHCISTRYSGNPSRATALHTIVAAADLLQAKACAVIAPESSNIEPEWVDRLASPGMPAGLRFRHSCISPQQI